MTEEKMSLEEVKRVYGIVPSHVGLRYRSWWIVEEIEEDEELAEAHIGDLCVKARDGWGNPPDTSVDEYLNYVGTIEDSFDATYRYYYFRPLAEEE